jgi:hypothetical protein
MRTVTVGLGERAYPIHIGQGLIARADLFLPHLPQPKVSVVTNTTVASLYLEKFSATLRSAGVEIVPVVLPDGEEHKNWQTLNSIFDALLSNANQRSLRSVVEWWAILQGLLRRVISAECLSFRCRRHCLRKWIHPSAARPRSITRSARI